MLPVKLAGWAFWRRDDSLGADGHQTRYFNDEDRKEKISEQAERLEEKFEKRDGREACVIQ